VHRRTSPIKNRELIYQFTADGGGGIQTKDTFYVDCIRNEVPS
jgi:hypothetical protein